VYAPSATRASSAAVVLATDRLDALRAGPRDSDRDDVVVAGVHYDRNWRTDDGRGAAAHLSVEVAWERGHVALESEAFP
jgi:hypothetical protein